MRTPLDGVRVVELASSIPGAYCGKLLADAGADVVRGEDAHGDPLRAAGPLHDYLATTRRSVGVAAALEGALRADVLVEDGRLTDGQIADLREANPSLVVVSITPFGRSGPDAGRVATEFTLQARCGSTGGRGEPGGLPLHAGGRIGEWVTGGYAAVGALAALRAGRGEHVDVSMLESMAITLQTYGSVTASLFAAAGRPLVSGRSLEFPSVEPTADGWVGFCLGTGQQLADFLVMIGQPELIGDPRFQTMGERARHREEFLAYVRGWTTKNTTADIVELATALRIPVADIGTPSTITGFEQFRERGVFVANPKGGWVQPRVPYRIGEFAGVPFAAAPDPGADEAGPLWTGPEAAPAGTAVQPPAPARAGGTGARPLSGLRVVDLTAFWAGPAATLTLAALGADVVKVESPHRPDGMRFASARTPNEDSWWEWGLVYFSANPQKRAVTLDLADRRGRELLLRLVADADVVTENFSPRVMDNLGLSWETLREINPRLVLVRMPAFGLTGPWRDRTGFAQTMEQVCGMAWMTGEADGPPLIPRGPCDPNAGTHAVFALLAALRQRDATGEGVLVEATMAEATLNVAAEALVAWTAQGREHRRAGNRGPGAAPQGVYRCAGDDAWLAVAVETQDHWRSLAAHLPGWSGEEDKAARCLAHDEIDDALGAFLAGHDAADAEALLLAAGVPAAVVVPPAGIAKDPQLAHRGFLAEVDHPVAGTHRVPGLPFRLASLDEPWITSPAPTMGQHNEEILGGELGLTPEELDDLAANSVTATRPVGM